MDRIIEAATNPQSWIALLTLTLLEVVLGIDNVVFISILAGRLPEEKRDKARVVGLLLAMGMRILLLLSIVWIMSLTKPWFSIKGLAISGKDLIMLGGGLFLIAKATHEIHNKLEGEEEHHGGKKAVVSFTSVIVQIVLIDIVFSLDSVITAVGMAEELWVMIAAVVIAIGFMLAFSKVVSDFVEKHPTVKMLALAFLVLIGVNLIAEGLHHHIPKGYTYFAMAFSVGVEILNLKMKKSKQPPVHLRRNAPEGVESDAQEPSL